jgi:putative hydrolases of HD superfamily
MGADRLRQQLAFVLEIDRLKGVLRRSYVLSGERLENSAEHSWHVALAAVLLAEHAVEAVNVTRVVRMLLCHDLVEIDAGDTFAYDDAGRQSQHDREWRAAERLFGLLPVDQREEWRALWLEFDAGVTAEARFAAAVDRLLPIMHNFAVQGRSWREHGVTGRQVRERSAVARDVAPALWGAIQEVIAASEEECYLQRDPTETGAT